MLVTWTMTGGLLTQTMTDGLLTWTMTDGLLTWTMRDGLLTQTMTDGILTQKMTDGLLLACGNCWVRIPFCTPIAVNALVPNPCSNVVFCTIGLWGTGCIHRSCLCPTNSVRDVNCFLHFPHWNISSSSTVNISQDV